MATSMTGQAVGLLSALGAALEPRAIVIKSECMRKLSSQLVAWSDIWRRENRATQENGDRGGGGSYVVN